MIRIVYNLIFLFQYILAITLDVLIEYQRGCYFIKDTTNQTVSYFVKFNENIKCVLVWEPAADNMKFHKVDS